MSFGATGGRADVEHELSWVIPAFNEGRRLPRTLDRIGAYLGEHPDWQPAEIIVVDDGSVDGTAATAEAAEVPPGVTVHVVLHASNRGKGAAVRGCKVKPANSREYPRVAVVRFTLPTN